MIHHRRKKPHPRSLDALFGPARPKKPPVKLCPAGHRQSSRWRPGQPCVSCEDAEWRELAALEAEAEREEWSRRHPVGPVLRHQIVATGRVVTLAIPGWARELRKRQDAARRRRPRSRSRI